MLCESIWEGRISWPTVTNVLSLKAGEAPDEYLGEVVGIALLGHCWGQGWRDKDLSRMIKITE